MHHRELSPLLWLFYVNDLEVQGFNTVKYADDTTFYKSFGKHTGTTAPAILNTIEWAQQNRMLLNADKTVILNLMFSNRQNFRIGTGAGSQEKNWVGYVCM